MSKTKTRRAAKQTKAPRAFDAAAVESVVTMWRANPDASAYAIARALGLDANVTQGVLMANGYTQKPPRTSAPKIHKSGRVNIHVGDSFKTGDRYQVTRSAGRIVIERVGPRTLPTGFVEIPTTVEAAPTIEPPRVITSNGNTEPGAPWHRPFFVGATP